MHFGYESLVIVLMLLCTAVFAGYEMALASISRANLAVLINQKKKGAEDAAFMKDRMEASLAVTQLGITLSGAIAAACGGAGVTEDMSPHLQSMFNISKPFADGISLVFLIIPLSALMIILGELIPKMYALNNRVTLCLKLSPAMKAMFHVAYPIVSVFEWIVKRVIAFGQRIRHLPKSSEDQAGLHELTAAVSLARTSRLIGAREEKIVLSAAQLSVRPVRDIILPISDVSTIPLNCTLTDALIRAHLDMHTRFPVCGKEGDPQTIQGYVNFKDIMMALKLNPADPSIKGIVRPIKTVNGNMPISQALEQMMQEKLHIALVGGDSGIIGMITLEDIIEELVGEIEDEFDRLPNHIHPYGNSWIMGGGVPMNVVAQTAGIEWVQEKPGEAVPKLAEWCARKLGGAPQGGETIESDGLTVMVRKLRRKKLGEAIVSMVNKAGGGS